MKRIPIQEALNGSARPHKQKLWARPFRRRIRTEHTQMYDLLRPEVRRLEDQLALIGSEHLSLLGETASMSSEVSVARW